MSDINMSVNIAGVELKNPVTVASGTFGSGMEYGEYVDLNRLGAVTTKGVANIPWPGNPTPRIAETYGLANSQLTFLKSISHALMSKRVELLSDRFHLLQRLLLRRLRRLQSSRLL